MAYGFKPDGTELSNLPSLVESVNRGVATVVTGLSEAGPLLNISGDFSAASVDDILSTITSFETNDIPGGPPYPNILEEFASYTPLWTLACLTPNQYNNPYSYRGKPGALENVVFSSAGRYDGQRPDTIVGAPEYFVNNFSMDMTTAASAKTGQTNLIKMSFEVYEPYSMGYFLHSLQAAAINSGYPTYNDTPYLLKLEFKGFTDDGELLATSEAHCKYWAIRILNATFTTTEGGSVYKVEATFFNQSSFSNTASQLFQDIKLKGPTVQEMLVGDSDFNLCKILNDAQVDAVLNKEQEVPDRYVVVFPENFADPVGLAISNASMSSLIREVPSFDPEIPEDEPIVENSEYDEFAGLDEAIAEQELLGAIEGDPNTKYGNNAIGSSDMGFEASSGGNYSFGLEGDVIDEATGLIKRGELTIDPKTREFQFGKGTQIQNVITQVILSSDYAKAAIDPKNIDEEGRLPWFRIDAQIELGDLDLLRNVRARKYIYRVLPFKVHSSVFRNTTSAPVGMSNLNKQIGKEYKYIYTGQNNDIIKFDLNINMLFNQGKLATPAKKTASEANPDVNQTDDNPGNTAEVDNGASAETIGSQNAISAKPDLDISKRKTKAGYGAVDVKTLVATNFLNAIENNGNPNGDLHNIKVEILGDPYWMTDTGVGNYLGDVYNGPYGGPHGQITKDLTLNYQGADTYIRLIFRTPVEPNLGVDGTGGLYNFPPGEKENPYSGIYKVNKVICTFRDGTFKQELDCVRMPSSPQDYDGLGGKIDKKSALLYDTSKEDTTSSSPIGSGEDPTDFWALDMAEAGSEDEDYNDEWI